MAGQRRHHHPKSAIDFISRVFTTIEAFRFKGKPYLSYLRSRQRSDEFLMRDNVIKPLFVTLGYHPQQDFSPEETIATGRVDTIIRNGQNCPVIVIETQSSLLKELSSHRRRLFSYAEDIGARFAVLTDGVRFEAWECPGRGKARFQRIALDFQDVFRRFVTRGINGLNEKDVEQLLKLKYLSKEFLFVGEEELYQEPELDVADDTVFSQLLEDVQGAMHMAKEDIQGQFFSRKREWQEYQDLLVRSESEPVYPSQLRKFQDSIRAIRAFEEWRKVSARANSGSEELFCTETMYILFNRLLLMRISEDKGLIARQISNGGIKNWLSFKGFFEFRKANYAELLRSAYETMNHVYPHLFRQDIFDWYTPESEIVLRILFVFNRYNFRNVNRDVLGKLYERYLEREERKRLGEFYTPEEVVDYILDVVGYSGDHEIEGRLLLDPACGSGGFLVRAVQTLSDRLKSKSFGPETILQQVQQSIYGFDINPFAAHLAETNLLFQVMDLINDAKLANPSFQMEKFNIFVTDSLKPPVQVSPRQPSLWEPIEGEYAEDAEVVKDIKLKKGKFSRGFDFIVGNPPYVMTENITPQYKKQLAKDYRNIYEGRFDLYIFFLGLGIEMLGEQGNLGHIVPGKFLVTENGGKLREHILQNCTIEGVVDVSQTKVFKDAGNYPVIIQLRKEPNAKTRNKTQVTISQWLSDSIELLPVLRKASPPEQTAVYKSYKISQSRFASNFDYIFDIGSHEEVYRLREKLDVGSERLGNICEIHQGIITGRKEPGDTARRKNIVLSDELRLLPEERAKLARKVIDGKNMPERYSMKWVGEHLIYAPQELTAPREARWFDTEKLVIQKIAKNVVATYDADSFYCLDTLYVALKKATGYNLRYVLAVLNSRLLNFYYSSAYGMVHIGSNYLEYRTRYLDNLPIKPAPPETQSELAKLANEMVSLNKMLVSLRSKLADFPVFVAGLGLSLIPLGSSGGVSSVAVPNVIGNPRLAVEGNKVQISSKAQIEMLDEVHARYVILYLESLKDALRGQAGSQLLQNILIPDTPPGVTKALAERVAIEDKISQLESRKADVDAEIDEKVYALYELNCTEMNLVKATTLREEDS